MTVYPMKQVRINNQIGSFYFLSKEDTYHQIVADDFESQFMSIVNLLVPRDGVCVDIGANVGIKTFSLSRHCEAGKVLAIEGGAEIFRILEMNVAANSLDNVILENVVVGDSNGEVRFVENSAFGHIDKNQGAVVPMATLDSIFSKHRLERLDFLKIDVEGFEIPILQASQDLLGHYNPVIHLEFNTWCHVAFEIGGGPRQLLSWLLDSFEYVYHLNHIMNEVRRVGAPDGGQERNVAIHSTLYQIMVNNGLYDDFLVTNNPEIAKRIAPILAH